MMMKSRIQQLHEAYLKDAYRDDEMRSMEYVLNDRAEHGDYQFVLEKACEIGDEQRIEGVVKLAREIGLPTLSMFEPFKIAAYYGHVEIVQLLIKRDLENEKYHGQTPNVLWSFLYEFKMPIPYVNDPLTTDQLKEIILETKKAGHTHIVDELEKYYKRMYEYKRASEINAANKE
jgi:hypothetical protein